MYFDFYIYILYRLLFKCLKYYVGEVILLYNMIEDGDCIMVCLFGGKDSYIMLELLIALQKKAPISFELVAVNLDQKQPGFPQYVLPEYLALLDIEYHIIKQNTYNIIKKKIPKKDTQIKVIKDFFF